MNATTVGDFAALKVLTVTQTGVSVLRDFAALG
jgi:hypothetical protein